MSTDDLKQNQANEEITLKELVLKSGEWYRYILSNWILLVFVGIVGGTFGFIYAWNKQVKYKATTTFVLEEADKGGGLGQYAGLASMAGIDLGGGGGGIFQGDNINELYKSRKMIERTLLTEIRLSNNNVLLVDLYIKMNKLREEWDRNPLMKNLQFKNRSTLGFTRLQDSVLGKIVNDIRLNYLKVAKPDKKLSIINVDITAPDELFAKLFNEQIVKTVNDFYIQTKIKKSLQSIAVLQQKTDSVRTVMNGNIYDVSAITDATPNLNPTRQTQRAFPMQRSQFSAETNKSMLAELIKNLEISKISLKKETPLIQVIDEPVFPLEKQKFGKVKYAIIGGILFGFLAVFFLTLKRILIQIMK